MITFIVLSAIEAAPQVKSTSGKIKETLPAEIDLTDTKLVEIKDEAGKVVLSGTFSNNVATLTSSDAESKAKGLAEIEIKKAGAVLKREFEAAVEGLPALTSFKLSVDGKEVATFMTDKSGKRSLEYSRKDTSK